MIYDDASELPPNWHLEDKWLAYDLAEREGPPPQEEVGSCQDVKEAQGLRVNYGLLVAGIVVAGAALIRLIWLVGLGQTPTVSLSMMVSGILAVVAALQGQGPREP